MPQDLYTPVQAFLRGQASLRTVEDAAGQGADLNAWQGPLTPIRCAVDNEHISLLELLLHLRADPNRHDARGVCPLHMAVFDGKGQCVTSLLDGHADVNIRDQHGQTPLFFAPSQEICELLITRQADVNVRNVKGQSPLHLAAHAGLDEAVEWLVTTSGKRMLEAKDQQGHTPLYYAAHARLRSTVGVLKKMGAQVHHTRPNGEPRQQRQVSKAKENEEPVSLPEVAQSKPAGGEAELAAVRAAMLGTDAEALSGALAQARHVGVRSPDLHAAERRLEALRRERAEEDLQQALAGSDLQALAAALQRCRAAGVREEVVKAAEETLQQREAEAALREALESNDLEGLELALHHARAAGVQADLLRDADLQLAELRRAEKRRGDAVAALQAALKAEGEEDSVTNLQRALQLAEEAELEAGLLQEGRLRLQYLQERDLRRHHQRQLEEASAKGDPVKLMGALHEAREAGMGEADLLQFQSRLEKLQAKRKQEEAEEALAWATKGTDPEKLATAIQDASQAGVREEALQDARRRLRGLQALVQRRRETETAEHALRSACKGEDAAALEVAIASAEEAGVQASPVQEATQRLQALWARQETQRLTDLATQQAAEDSRQKALTRVSEALAGGDLGALERAVSEAEELGVEGAQLKEARERLQDMRAQEESRKRVEAVLSEAMQAGDADTLAAAISKASPAQLPLSITVVSARGLRNTDWFSKSDPYCTCKLNGKEILKTAVITDSLQPTWNHKTQVAAYTLGDSLVFSVFDQDQFRDDCLGHVTLESDKFFPSGFKGEVPLAESGKGAKGSQASLAVEVLPVLPPAECALLEEARGRLADLRRQEAHRSSNREAQDARQMAAEAEEATRRHLQELRAQVEEARRREQNEEENQTAGERQEEHEQEEHQKARQRQEERKQEENQRARQRQEEREEEENQKARQRQEEREQEENQRARQRQEEREEEENRKARQRQEEREQEENQKARQRQEEREQALAARRAAEDALADATRTEDTEALEACIHRARETGADATVVQEGQHRLQSLRVRAEAQRQAEAALKARQRAEKARRKAEAVLAEAVGDEADIPRAMSADTRATSAGDGASSSAEMVQDLSPVRKGPQVALRVCRANTEPFSAKEATNVNPWRRFEPEPSPSSRPATALAAQAETDSPLPLPTRRGEDTGVLARREERRQALMRAIKEENPLAVAVALGRAEEAGVDEQALCEGRARLRDLSSSTWPEATGGASSSWEGCPDDARAETPTVVPELQDGCLLWAVPLEKEAAEDKFGFREANGKLDFEHRASGSPRAEGEPPLLPGPQVLVVRRIHEHGLLHRWNLRHPEAPVRAQDRIVSVNGESTVEAMQREIRSTKILLKVMRYPEVFAVTLRRRGSRLGFRIEYPQDTDMPEVRISQLTEGALPAHNREQVKAGLWHYVVLPDMRIQAVNNISGSAWAMSEELKKSENVTLIVRRAEERDSTLRPQASPDTVELLLTARSNP